MFKQLNLRRNQRVSRTRYGYRLPYSIREGTGFKSLSRREGPNHYADHHHPLWRSRLGYKQERELISSLNPSCNHGRRIEELWSKVAYLRYTQFGCPNALMPFGVVILLVTQ